MKKVVRLTESDLYRIVRQVINEQQISNDVLMSCGLGIQVNQGAFTSMPPLKKQAFG